LIIVTLSVIKTHGIIVISLIIVVGCLSWKVSFIHSIK